jgi:serine/threonine protein kinase
VQSYIGPYRILRFLNEGAQGRVYLGYDERLQRRLAIKIYSLPVERVGRRKLLQEAQLVAKMESPKIVQVHDVIESQGHLAMVMEYVPGCSLEDVLSRTRLSLAAAMTVAIDLAGALAIARQRKILHGDLKAANVLITPSGRAKLTDFGIAREQIFSSLTGRDPGSLSALSPEQWMGHPGTEQSDLFALGVLIYRMLSGEHPFFQAGKFDLERLATVQKTPLREIVPGDVVLPDDLLGMIDELLALDPKERPRHTRGVRQVMRGILRDMPTAAQNSLPGEAKPFFRSESPEDVPAQIPVDLARGGRSRMPPAAGVLSNLSYFFRGFKRGAQAALIMLSLCLVLLSIWLFDGSRVTTVEFQSPEIQLSSAVNAPPGFSPRWLIYEIKQVVATEIGPIRVTSDVGADTAPTVYSAHPSEEKAVIPQQSYATSLRCLDEFCVLTMNRRTGDHVNTAQGVLFHGESLEAWGEIIRWTAADLFR